MYKLIIVFFFSLFFTTISCKNKNTIEEKSILTSNFSLKEDITYFSETMTESDTIFVCADLSVCMVRLKYYNCITKSQDTVFIETKSIETSESMNETIDYGKVVYKKDSADSLNFENMFLYMQQYADSKDNTRFTTLQITYKTDTLYYKLNGILKILDFTEYYMAIMYKYYPDFSEKLQIKH